MEYHFANGQLATNEKGTYFSAKLMHRVTSAVDLYQEDGQWIAEFSTRSGASRSG